MESNNLETFDTHHYHPTFFHPVGECQKSVLHFVCGKDFIFQLYRVYFISPTGSWGLFSVGTIMMNAAVHICAWEF